ncbi:MAG TPA: hypothetical protein VFG62_25880 [Rhodopila sp.]|jgi:hypothetical protein|nr:hypothetical protein [Rhodopila sp.]
MPLYSTSSATGSYSGSSALGYNRIVVNGDNVTGPNAIESGLYLEQDFGGTGTQGSRSAINIRSVQIGPYDSGLTGFQNAQVGATIAAVSSYNDGGTSSAPAGYIWALNTVTTLNSGATYKQGMLGYEVDMNLESGASSNTKVGISVGSSAADTAQGGLFDAAFLVRQADTSAAPGWANGYSVGDSGEAFPLASSNGEAFSVNRQTLSSTLTILKQPVGVRGVDLFDASWSDRSWLSRNISMYDSGDIRVGSADFEMTTTGAALDSHLYKLSGVTVTSGGAGCFVGWNLEDKSTGTVLTVTACSGSAIASGGLSITTPGVVASSPPTSISFAMPNGGTNAVVATTWTLANSLQLNPSGGAITMGGQVTLASSTTGAGAQTFTNSPCTGLTTERWVPISITGQSGTFYVPACQ